MRTWRNLLKVIRKAVASPGFFGWGGDAPATSGLSRAPRSGSGPRRPPDGSEIAFLKTIQSIRKLIEFSKISTFFLLKRSIFSKNNLKNLNIFDRNFRIFWNNYLKIFNFYETNKASQFIGEFSYLVGKFTVAAPGIFRGTPGPFNGLSGGPGGEGPPPDGS